MMALGFDWEKVRLWQSFTDILVRRNRPTLIRSAPRVVPHNFMGLSFLLLVISIASDAQVMFHREQRKAVKVA